MSLLTNIVFYAKFDDNTGSTVTESVASHNGTWQGTLGSQWTTGIINSGGNFNGTNNYVTFGSPSLGLSGNQPFSISLWVNPTATALGAGPFDYGILANNERISLLFNDTAGTLLSSHFGNDHAFSTKATLSAWNHLVLTYDGTTEHLYKNGADTGESWTPASLSMSGGSLFVGAGLSPTAMKAAKMDEVGFWSRALSSSEASQLYNSGSGLQYPFTTGLPSPFLLTQVGS